MTHCRACYSPDMTPVPFAVPASGGEWFRCKTCGSDTAAHGYDPGMYTDALAGTHRANIGGADAARLAVRSNCDWYGHYAKGLPNRHFLDVGCADGAALGEMRSLGWTVHGFDVCRPDYADDGIDGGY